MTMKSGFRHISASVSAKLAEKNDPDVLMADSVREGADRALVALRAYESSLQSHAAATLGLLVELAAFYPTSGPLSGPLVSAVAASGGGGPTILSPSPFRADSVASVVERLEAQLPGPAEGIAAMAAQLIETINARNRLSVEREHYVAKVGRLTTSASERGGDKGRLAENQQKLATVMTEHASLVRKVQEGSAALEPDLVAVLTPTLSQVLRIVQQSHADAAAFLQGTLDAVPLNERNRPAVAAPPPSSKPLQQPGVLSAPGVAGWRPVTTTTTTSDQSSRASVGAATTGTTTTTTGGARAAAPPAPAPARVPAPAPAPAPVPTPSPTPAPGSDLADLMRAEATYTAQADGDLSMEGGSLLLVVRRDASGWWECRRGGEFGQAPSNYLVPAAAEAAGEGGLETETRTALFDYTPEDGTEIGLRAGEGVQILATPPTTAGDGDGGWVIALTRGGRVGFVPSNRLAPPVVPAPSTTPAVVARPRVSVPPTPPVPLAAAAAAAAGLDTAAAAAAASGPTTTSSLHTAVSGSPPPSAGSMAPALRIVAPTQGGRGAAPAPAPAPSLLQASPAGLAAMLGMGGGGGGGGKPRPPAPAPALPLGAAAAAGPRGAMLAGIQGFSKGSLKKAAAADAAPAARAALAPAPAGGPARPRGPAPIGGGGGGGGSLLDEMRARQARGRGTG